MHRDRDAWGSVTGMRLGNGALVSRTFEPGSGRQTRGDVRLSGKLRHDALYSWRTDGLLAGRSVRGLLDDGVSSGLREEAFAHDGLGNLLSRTSDVAADVDVVEYDYGAGRNAVRHARIGDVRHQFAYDRHVEWDGRGLARRVLLGGGPPVPDRQRRRLRIADPGRQLRQRVVRLAHDQHRRSPERMPPDHLDVRARAGVEG